MKSSGIPGEILNVLTPETFRVAYLNVSKGNHYVYLTIAAGHGCTYVCERLKGNNCMLEHDPSGRAQFVRREDQPGKIALPISALFLGLM